uniref:DnaJ heat shock protein family (Hsp40) member B12b n=1 Tax=Tetraodon nigroviridis TaxID=99883 RepID=H3DQ00_TETNG
MEVNRDEAERCIDIATAALSSCQTEKARRFLEKAQRLFPTAKAKALLELTAQYGFAPKGEGPSDIGGQQQTGGEDTRPEEKPSDTSKPYMADQQDAVRRIKQCKNFYEILGVQKDASEDELKRSYRKLAGCVIQGEKGGSDREILHSMPLCSGCDAHLNHQGEASSHTFSSRGEKKILLLQGGLALFVQVMPILILVIVSALSQIMVNSPAYSLSYRPSAGYTQKRLTENLKVPYYVGEQFSKEYSGVILKNLERSVEDDYISNLRNNCWKEKQQKEGMLYRARYFGDTDLYQRQRARTPSCAKLSDITATLHG